MCPIARRDPEHPAARVLQGVAGATLMPATLGLIRSMFLDPRQRTVAIAVWSAMAGARACPRGTRP